MNHHIHGNARRPQLPACLLPVCLLFACSPAIAAERVSAPRGEATARPPVVAPRPVTVQFMSWPALERAVQSRAGKVVVVDIWTTTCPVCRAEFPNFTALERHYGRDRVRCISVNCDYDGVPGKPPAWYLPRVTGFLGRQETIDTHVMLTESFIDFLKRIDLRSTPAVLVFDRQGQLARRFDNDNSRSAEEDFSANDVHRFVGTLLARE